MVKIFIQSKIEDNQVKIAENIQIEEETTNREIITLIQELRHITTFLEKDLYNQWENKNEKN